MRTARGVRVSLNLVIVFASAVLVPTARAGELVADEKTLLLLHCNGSLLGGQGRRPQSQALIKKHQVCQRLGFDAAQQAFQAGANQQHPRRAALPIQDHRAGE